jgi:hypothetical protein
MKRLLFLLMTLSLTTIVTAGPVGFTIYPSLWTESFTGGAEGAAGNLLSANGAVTFDIDPINTYDFWISNAENQGAKPYSDPYNIYDYVTEYNDAQYIDSFFDVWFEIDFTNYTDVDTGKFLISGKGHDTEGLGYSIAFQGDGVIIFSDFTGNAGFIEGSGTIACVPAPGALLLGSLGVALVGAIRRRLA